MTTPESRLLAEIRATLGRLRHVRVFRNNVGSLRDAEGRYVQYGLCTGSADLIGWVNHNGAAVFLAIEVKARAGRVTPEQQNFLRVVRESGGVAGVCRSVEEALALISPDNGH